MNPDYLKQFELINEFMEENNFKQIHTNFARRGDIVFLETKEELGGTMGICQGEQSIFKFKSGQENVPTNKCSIAWRIE